MILSDLFSDGVVFQREKPIKVFGEGEGEIEISFLGETKKENVSGKFCIALSAHPAGGPYEMVVNLNGEKRVIRDIMIGEVIGISGQSNAALPIYETFDKDKFFESNDNIRIYLTVRPDVDELEWMRYGEINYTGKWTSFKSEESIYWCAMALHIARYYNKKLGVPVGIVEFDKWGSSIQSYMPQESLKPFNERLQKAFKENAECEHFHAVHVWNEPSLLYHLQVERVAPFVMRSILWYQGETNIYEGDFHDDVLCQMIKDWRKVFQNDELIFAVVGINDFPEYGNKFTKSLREAQKRAAERTENCVYVRIDDLGEYDQIHPRNKYEVIMRAVKELDRYYKL